MRTIRTTLLLLCALTSVASTQAMRTQTHRAAPELLIAGEADGVAVSRDGRLSLAPRLRRLGDGAGEPAQVFASIADRVGNLILGTGPDGRVLKIDPAGHQHVLFSTPEPLVTALALLPDGDLLAATAPGGALYRIDSTGTGERFGETGVRYVWSLLVTDDGEIFAGTGEQGAILKIDSAGRPEPFFDSDEAHIVSLALAEGGDLLAGGAGRGLVYRVDPEGNALVLYDDDLEEAVALIPEAGGGLLAAFVAAPLPAARRPAVRLRLPDGVQVGSTDETVARLEEGAGPTLRGEIEGLPDSRGSIEVAFRGRLVRIDSEGRAEEIWSSREEAPFSLLPFGTDSVLLGTGEPARLYRVDASGDVALLSTLREAQLTELLRVGRATCLVTSNPGAAYRIESGAPETGTYLSVPVDAGGPARWGTIRWRLASGGGRAEVYTRTGNSRIPDGTWSAWSPVLRDPGGSAVVNPDSRFLQWRIRFAGPDAEAATLSGFEVTFEPYNRPPQIRDFRLEDGGPSTAGDARFGWAVLDPDEDPLDSRLEYRQNGAGDWREAALAASGETGESGPGWRRLRVAWDTTEVPEGQYEVRAVSSDVASNPPGEGREVDAGSSLRLVVDRTAPEIETTPGASGSIQIVVTDAVGRVAGLALVRDGEVLHTLRPTDGISDSSRESYRVEPPDQPGDWSLRATDAAGNSADRPWPAP